MPSVIGYGHNEFWAKGRALDKLKSEAKKQGLVPQQPVRYTGVRRVTEGFRKGMWEATANCKAFVDPPRRGPGSRIWRERR
jgi:hypothetical protein